MQPLKICLAGSEFAPLAKTGGLADVCSALAVYLHESGHDVRMLLPLYAQIDRSTIDITPVAFLQNLSMDFSGHRVTYSIDTAKLPGTDMPLYLLRCDEMYRRQGIYASDGDEHRRFLLLSRACIEMCQHMGWSPDIIHCNDWHTAMIPPLLKSVYAWDDLFANTRTVLTIHNISYQGVFGTDVLGDTGMGGCPERLHQDDMRAGRINFLKNGLLYADHITTVSPTYAREIQTPQYAFGLDDVLRFRSDHLTGILNGVDYAVWDPANDALIPQRYTSDTVADKAKNKVAVLRELSLPTKPDLPLLGMVTRLTGQKGIELVQAVLPAFLNANQCRFVVLGSGEVRFEQFFTALQRQYPDLVCYYKGFNERLAHWIEAGSDIFLMPSLFEPCGLNQMYSLRYGTVPVVRQTGGLADSVQQYDAGDGSGTGVVFHNFESSALKWGLNRALELYGDAKHWRQIMRNAMDKDFSWNTQGAVYVRLYNQLKGQ